MGCVVYCVVRMLVRCDSVLLVIDGNDICMNVNNCFYSV